MIKVGWQLAIQKILMHHLDFEIEPLFEWELGMLPHVASLFCRARACPDGEEGVLTTELSRQYFYFPKACR